MNKIEMTEAILAAKKNKKLEWATLAERVGLSESAIDFTLEVQKDENPKGDRVVVVMNGKFLPYKRF